MRCVRVEHNHRLYTQPAPRLFADFHHRFSLLSLASIPSEGASEDRLIPPLVHFTLPSITALRPTKVDGIMSWLGSFRGVLREEHSWQVFLFVWKWERKCV